MIEESKGNESEVNTRPNRNRSNLIMRYIQDGVIITNEEGFVVSVNQAAISILGYPPDEIKGARIGSFLHFTTDSIQPSQDISERALAPENKYRVVKKRGKIIRLDGMNRDIYVQASQTLNKDDSCNGIVIVLQDETRRNDFTRKLDYYSQCDPLTGLLNRSEFEAQTSAALEEIASGHGPHMLFFIALDHFKTVNNACGHIAGDDLLKQFAALLNKHSEAKDFIGRLSGDEFAILYRNTSLLAGKTKIEALRKSILDFVFSWGKDDFNITACIGGVEVGAQTIGLQVLYSSASDACDKAKLRGPGCIIYHEESSQETEKKVEQFGWTYRIKTALSDDRFALFYQTVQPLSRSVHKFNYYELLLRLKDDENGFISPMEFIPVAEHYNMMTDIDRWVIDQAIRAVRDLQDEFTTDDCVFAVNLSGQTIGDHRILDFIQTKMDQTGINPGFMCFEVTETVAVTNLSHAINFINELQSMGCKFSLDDFGSGLSSYAYLKNLPVNYLKIDGHFIQDIAKDPLVYAMVESINNIGHVMNMQTIAEFVNDDYTIMLLKDIGVDFIQGFFNGIPRNFNEFDKTLSKNLNILR